MAVTPASVKAFAPELAGVDDGILTTLISWAPGHVSASVFGTDHDQAVTLWTAHTALRQAGGASGTIGPVTGRKVGDVTVNNSGSDAADVGRGYGTTGYGVALQRLIRRYRAGGQVV